jgi:hypothetical protein
MGHRDASELYMEEFCSLLRTELAITASAQSSVWLFVVKAGRNHILHSHNYVFAATLGPLVLLLPTNIAALQNINFAIIGALHPCSFLPLL